MGDRGELKTDRGELKTDRGELAHGITQSSAANYATGEGLDKGIKLVQKVFHVHLRAWGNLEPPALRRYRQRGTMGKAKGY